MNQIFIHDTYHIKRKFSRFFGALYLIKDNRKNPLAVAEVIPMKLLTEIKIYDYRDINIEYFAVKPRQRRELLYTYDVYDVPADKILGSVQRDWQKSVIKETWLIHNDQDQEIGTIQIDNMAKEFLRDLLPIFAKKFVAKIHDHPVARYKKHATLFCSKMTVIFEPGMHELFDKRLGLASALLLLRLGSKAF